MDVLLVREIIPEKAGTMQLRDFNLRPGDYIVSCSYYWNPTSQEAEGKNVIKIL